MLKTYQISFTVKLKSVNTYLINNREVRQMKEHEVAILVNELTSEVRRVCKDTPQCLREVIAKVVRKNLARSNANT